MGVLCKVDEVLNKNCLYDELKGGWNMHSDLVMCLGDFNGHAGRDIDGFNGVLVGYDVGRGNLEGRMLEFCLDKELCVKYMV